MRKRVFTIGAFVLLLACRPNEDFGDLGCQGSVKTCRVVEAGFGGYQRACMTTCPGFDVERDDEDRDDDDESRDDSASDAEESASSVDAASESESLVPTAASRNVGAAPAPDMTRYSAFEMACERDSQCGPGKCLSGNCYYGCQSDSQCGSGDRCSVESGIRVCMPDPNPPVECTRSAQCDSGEGCLNGGCRQTCTSTEQCDNLLDRCGSGFCLPDRRPLGECVVNSECDAGLVCLDGSCVPACPAEEEAGGVCLAEPSSLPAAPEEQTPSELPTDTPPEAPADQGSTPDEQTSEDEPISSEPEESADDSDAPISSDADDEPDVDDDGPEATDDGTTPTEDDEPETPTEDEEEPAPSID